MSVAFPRHLFRQAFAAVGIWDSVRVTSQDTPPVVIETEAGYIRPDVVKMSNALSAEHEMKYQADQLPDLAEGDGVEFLSGVATGMLFQVRSTPFVSDDPAEDRSGYFKWAYLTRVNAFNFELREDGGYELRE